MGRRVKIVYPILGQCGLGEETTSDVMVWDKGMEESCKISVPNMFNNCKVTETTLITSDLIIEKKTDYWSHLVLDLPE